MASQITYDDKVSLKTSPLPNTNKCTAEDLNEIKTVVNANAIELDNMGTEIYTAQSMTAQSSITFEDISDYDYVEFLYGGTGGDYAKSLKIIPSISIGHAVTFGVDGAVADNGGIYYNVARYNLTATELTFVRVSQKEFRANATMDSTTSTTPTNIMIYKILGYKKG